MTRALARRVVSSEKKNGLTPEQEAAVKFEGGALLVSAAAGAGKTKVLVERLLHRVANGDDIDKFLVITYTRAAAAELRDRIREELASRLAEAPENRNLRRQLLLCRGAHISTIHSFCAEILRENAHLTGLTPDFRVTDESENGILKAEILKDVLEKAYETIGTSDDFRALIDTMAGGRDDARVMETVLNLHAKLQSNPDPQRWAAEQISGMAMDDVTDISETAWGGILIKRARRAARFWRGEMERLREDMRAYPDFEAGYGESVDATIISLADFQASLDAGWEEAKRCCNIDFPAPIRTTGYESLKDTRKRCSAAMKKATAIFNYGSGEYIEDMRAVVPAVTALINITLDFDKAYTAEKRRRFIADFSDMEHLTLSLLFDSEKGVKTNLARIISRRFKEIMIDEYQDVNAVQEYIFSALSQDGGNLFMVGDVKQSIYRFRLADPSIFLAKYRSFETYAGEGLCQEDAPAECLSARKILLSRNFRSRAGILDAVNFVFGSIMSVDFGEMDYTGQEFLVPDRTDDGASEPDVGVCMIETRAAEEDDGEENPAAEQIEARYIARRIAELTDGSCTIPDGRGGRRRVEYQDIVILLRVVRNKAWIYASALAERGIPADIPGSEGFFETAEITAALSLLEVVDNPMQDIPLVSALRGPVYGFTADELAEIRSGSRGTDFYGAIVSAAERKDGMQEGVAGKCAAFLEELDAFRMVAADMPADKFIRHVYNKTGLTGRVGAMSNGDKRRNNLIALADHAHRFEESGYKGLFGFLTYIRGLRERGADLGRETTEPPADSVRIMSVHKSKGLEFPVVILAGASKKIVNQDARQRLVIHHELGVGAMRTDMRRRIEYPTLARIAIQNRLDSDMLAEELRLLYVAMTRAREKLLITAVYPDASIEIRKLQELAGGNALPLALEETRSMAGWILLPLSGSPEIESLIQDEDPEQFTESDSQNEGSNGGQSGQSGRSDERSGQSGRSGQSDERSVEIGAIKVTRVPFFAPEPVQVHDEKLERFSLSSSDEESHCPGNDSGGSPSSEYAALPEDVEELRRRFSFSYPYGSAPDLPSKLTVTGLKGRHFGDEQEKETAMLEDSEEKERSFTFSRPRFVTGRDGLTAAERGTALHLAMQYIDFGVCADETGVGDELDRMVRDGILTEEERGAVKARKITRFFESEIGKRVLRADMVRREFKFSLLYAAESFFTGGGDDEILLQGIVDCFFEEGDGLVVVDFKTDSVTPETVEEKAGQYAQQLIAYANALERITGKRVNERVIYFFALDSELRV